MKSEVKTRYSTEELKEFEILLLEKKKVYSEQLESSKQSLINVTEEMRQNNDLLCPQERVIAKEITLEIERDEKMLQYIDAALVRIKHGTYGICIKSGKLIPKERLMAVPHTTSTIEVKLKRVA